MFLSATFQLMPASLLLLIATAPTSTRAINLPWPFDPITFWSGLRQEGAPVREGGASPVQSVARQPVALRKMSGDEGEMFFPEYWRFEAKDIDPILGFHIPKPRLRPLKPSTEKAVATGWANTTMQQPLQAPFPLHTNQQIDTPYLLGRINRWPRTIFSLNKRDFQCPGDTSACSAINRPNSCCPTDTSCQLITDSGLGDVGCCGNGQSCSEQVSSCQQGYGSCSSNSGGGCCLPGYVCMDVGCKVHPTLTR